MSSFMWSAFRPNGLAFKRNSRIKTKYTLCRIRGVLQHWNPAIKPGPFTVTRPIAEVDSSPMSDIQSFLRGERTDFMGREIYGLFRIVYTDSRVLDQTSLLEQRNSH